MKWLLLLAHALLPGCLDAASVTCSDGLVCPRGDSCDVVNHRCLDPGALAACTGLGDGADCTVHGAAGSCQTGACIAFRCGDLVRNGGEACDHDDLGGQDCTTFGFSKPDGLACHDDCTVNTDGCRGVCGDGARDGIESCDGTDFGGKDCIDFGFYDHSGLACDTTCNFDTSACTGRCGDLIVNGPEACDGSPPAAMCLDDGFDMGGLRCSAACTASSAACGMLAWRQYASPSLTIHALWAAANHEYYACTEDGVLHFRDGLWKLVAASPPCFAIEGRAANDFYVAAFDDTLYHWEGAAFTQATTFLDNSVVAIVEAAPSEVWLLGNSIQHWSNGTLSTMAVPGGSRLYGAWWFAANDLWAYGYPPAVLHYDGSSWTQSSVPSIGSILSIWGAGPHDLWVGGQTATAHYDGTSWQAIRIDSDPAKPGSGLLWGSGPDDVVAIGGNGGSPPTSYVYRWDGTRWIREADVPFAIHQLTGFAGELMAEFNNTTFYGRGVAEWSTYALPGTGGAVQLFGTDDGWAVTQGGPPLYWDGTAWSAPATTPPLGASSLWGAASNDIWFGAFGGLMHWDGSTWTSYFGAYDPTINIDALFGTSASDIWASDDAKFWHWDGTTWTSMPTTDGITYTSIHGSGPADIWAVGGYDPTNLSSSSLVHYDGTSWSSAVPNDDTFKQTTFYSVWASSPTDAWLSGNNAIYHWDGTTWSPSPLPVLDYYHEVYGTARDDVFAVGSHTLLHFDGVQWAPIRTRTIAVTDDLARIAVTPHAVAITSAVNNGQTGAVDVLIRHGRWACRATETSCNDGIDDDCDGAVDGADSDCP